MADEALDPDSLAGRINILEEVYEYMLAYAAQGRLGNEDGAGYDVRGFLERGDEALDGLAEAAGAEVAGTEGVQAADYADFLKLLDEDARKARAGIKVVLGKSAISSQLIDNLNASIHIRAPLTDLFIIDEALKEPEG